MHNLRLRASEAMHYNILAFRNVFPVEQQVTCIGDVQAIALPSTDVQWCFLLRYNIDENVCHLHV